MGPLWALLRAYGRVMSLSGQLNRPVRLARPRAASLSARSVGVRYKVKDGKPTNVLALQFRGPVQIT